MSTFDFVQRLEAFFTKAETDFEKFVDAFLPKLEHTVEVAFADLAELAGRSVLDEATKLISGQEKFGNAVANVIQSVEVKGKTVALNVAQASVQAAFETAVDVAKSLVK